MSEETRRFSGGEKARLVLALIVWQRPNLLLLDEPTNHLDLDMRQALTEALIDFEGALVVVSHDRHLIRSTTDDLYLVHDGKVEPFDGDLEDYQQWLSDSQKQESQSGEPPKESGNSARARKDQKRREAELRSQTQPLRKEIARLEKEMDKLNAQLASAEEKLGDSELYDASRKAELTECLQQQASAKTGLRSARWPAGGPWSSWSACFRKAKLFLFILPARTLPLAGWVSALFMVWPSATSMICFCCKLASLAARPHIG